MSAVESRLAATLARHTSFTSVAPSRVEGWHIICQCGPWTYTPETYAAHVAAVIASSDDLAVIAKPDAKNPTPALIEAAYIAQDDLSKPPEPWLIESTAEIIDAYVDAQGHDTVHVIGHDAALLAAAKAAEGVSDRG